MRMRVGEYRTDGAALRTETRVDRGDLLPAVRTPEGFLLVQGRIAKPGVLRYVQQDGTVVRELLPPETLYDPKSLETLARKPVTLDHPTGKVDSTNVQRLGVGDIDGMIDVPTVEEQRLGGFVLIRMAIRRKDAVDAVDGGKVELSPGYDVDIDPTPGSHPIFGEYDAIQVARRYNHGAIVDAARGGAEILLRADGAQLRDGERVPTISRNDGANMHLKLLATLLALGVTRSDAEAEAAKPSAGMQAMQAAYDKMKADLDEMKAEIDKYAAANDAKNAEAEAAAKPEAIAKADAAREAGLIAYATERAPLLGLAKAHKLDGADKLGNTALRKAIVERSDAKARKDGSVDYYAARVDAMLAAGPSASAWDAASPDKVQARTDADNAKRDDGLDPWTRGQRKAKAERDAERNPTA